MSHPTTDRSCRPSHPDKRRVIGEEGAAGCVGLTFPGLRPPGLGTLSWSRWKTSLECRRPVPQESHSGHSLA